LPDCQAARREPSGSAPGFQAMPAYNSLILQAFGKAHETLFIIIEMHFIEV
jgi:hypothetical protein